MLSRAIFKRANDQVTWCAVKSGNRETNDKANVVFSNVVKTLYDHLQSPHIFFNRLLQHNFNYSSMKFYVRLACLHFYAVSTNIGVAESDKRGEIQFEFNFT